MIKQFNILLFAVVAFSCKESSTEKAQTSSVANIETGISKIEPKTLFTLSDAEKIFGEPAHLKDSSTIINNKVLVYQCEYASDSKDTGHRSIYFMFEEYKDLTAAKNTYSSIKSANEDHEGIMVLENVGDEAYFHTDSENFYFILARKGQKMVRLKVNKITSNTSLDEFNDVSAKIVTKM